MMFSILGMILGMSSLAAEITDVGTIWGLAEDLIGSPLIDVCPVFGGGNNRLYRIDTKGLSYALKFYPRQDNKEIDRQGAESRALKFLEQYSVGMVPRILAEDRKHGCAVLDWIDGERIERPRDDDIDKALRFLVELKSISTMEGADCLASASAATFSGSALTRQIDERFEKLSKLEKPEKNLLSFLEKELAPAKQVCEAYARKAFESKGQGFDKNISLDQRTLSPSDFGFHNAIRKPSGQVIFLDFEYFGWDDPAKLVSDFLWHPGMQLPSHLKERFRVRVEQVFNIKDEEFVFRLAALYPLYGVCWCLIMLNEFLPEYRYRRALAGHNTSKQVIESEQLARARILLKKVLDYNDLSY